MARFTLVSHHLCPYVQRAAITLAEKTVDHERVAVDLSAKPDWFTAISPLGKVPLLKVGERVLFESAVICEYLDEVTPGSLHPEDPLEKAEHRAWIEFASAMLNAIGGFYNAPDAAAFEDKRTAMAAMAGRLEAALGPGPYFAGARFHLVDAAFGPVFRYFDVFDRIGDFGVFAATPKVRPYRAALADRPSVAGAATPDYSARLEAFLRARPSHLGSLAQRAA
jgi:glutathione S-transferase